MSRRLQRFAVFTFATTHDALDAEDALKAEGLAVVPIPTPSGAPNLCGIAMRVPPTEADAARIAIEAAGIAPTGQIEIEDY